MIRRAVVLTCLVSTVGAARPPATLADLQALASQKAWAELLERAEDVPAATRTDSWRNLVTDAATAAVEAATPTDEEPFAAARKARTLGQRYAFLAKAAPYTAARDASAVKGLERCLAQEGRDCVETYQQLAVGTGPESALKAARLVRQGRFAYVAMPLFALAVGERKDSGVCKDEALGETVLAALDLPVADARAAEAKKVVFERCWAALGAKLKAATVGGSAYFLENTCQPMRARKALTELQDDLCKDAGL
ncbi:hypothetical protein [Myxococcus sp. CA056]|uniref:hypothetical protein n=1 Tax=Myxococcus sp. CA056 TaxID=2741740 RepID=UPI001C2CC97D|nr:hypothetical protein [Myxococcus sp. CA056]